MIRGLKNHAGVLYQVKDDTLYSIDSSGLSTSRGVLLSKTGFVDMESTVTQLAVNDGTFLYVFNPATNSFVTATGYPGGDRILSINQRIVGITRGTIQFRWSALANAALWGALDFASTETTPRANIACIEQDGELVFMKSDVTEIWAPNRAGSADAVYLKSNTTPHYGCLAPQSLRKTPQTVFWLGSDDSGSAQVLGMRGHQVQRISDRSLEEQLTSSLLAQASAFTYTDGGHSFYCLNAPGLETTWVYDETFPGWHERAEWNGKLSPWRPTCHAFAYGRHYMGAADGTLWILDPTLNKFGADVKHRRRIAPVVSKPDQEQVTYRRMELVCDKGQGGTAVVKWSDDNGARWSNEHKMSLGAVGKFNDRVKLEAMGSGRNRVYDISVGDDVSWNPVELDMVMA